ncbi:MAG: hypothetical protein ACM3OO_09350 [Planctomycetaceae bacterium]
MRRTVVSLVLALATLLTVAAPPSSALTKAVTNLPALKGFVLPGACFDGDVTLTERKERTLTTFLDGKTVVKYVIGGGQTTLFENEAGAQLTIDTTGTTTLTPNGDGTWTSVQQGSGWALVPPSDPTGPTLVWFTGTVTSVGTLDEKTFAFDPATQTRSGITSDICLMLVSGLKIRH